MSRFLVYGTLRQGHPQHRSLLTHLAEFVGERRVAGYDLYSLGWFPGIKPNPKNREGFVGELYNVPDHLEDSLIELLDRYEGYVEGNPNSLFLRKQIDVDGLPTTVYVYNGMTHGDYAKLIPSGDWRRKE